MPRARKSGLDPDGQSGERLEESFEATSPDGALSKSNAGEGIPLPRPETAALKTSAVLDSDSASQGKKRLRANVDSGDVDDDSLEVIKKARQSIEGDADLAQNIRTEGLPLESDLARDDFVSTTRSDQRSAVAPLETEGALNLVSASHEDGGELTGRTATPTPESSSVLNKVQNSVPSQQARFIYHPRKGIIDMNPPPYSERFKLSRSEFEVDFNNAPAIKKRHREIAAQRPRVHEAQKAYDEAEKAVKEQRSKLKALSVSKVLYEVRMRSMLSEKWKLQKSEQLLMDKETDLLHEETILDRMFGELERSRARCWRDQGDEPASDGIEINKSKARRNRNITAAANAPDTQRHEKAVSDTNSKAAETMRNAQQGASGGSAHLGATERTTDAPQTIEAMMKQLEELKAENAKLKASQDHRA